jgi:cobalt/nickel transport system permease protein
VSHDPRPDGRLRLAAVLAVSLTAASIRSTHALAALLLLAILAALVLILRAERSAGPLARRMAIVSLFVLWIWLTVPVDWRSLSLHDAGITLAWQMTLRIELIALAALLLLGGMDGIDLARAAVGLGLPRSLGALLAVSVRQIALLGETHQRLRRAMRARAYRPQFSRRTLQVSAQGVAWLIIHAWLRAERLGLGLKARGLAATGWPVRQASGWRSLPWSEWVILAGVIAALAVALTMSGIRG